MRLIDTDKFANDEYFEKRYGTDFYWEFRKRLDMQPTVDVLDKIRAEIEFEVDHRNNMLCAEDVFEIIDKYK